jgi:hypothetical protein
LVADEPLDQLISKKKTKAPPPKEPTAVHA